MSAIAFDGGIGFAPGTTDPPELAGSVFWAQGVGEVVDLSAAAVVLRYVMSGAAAQDIPALQAAPLALLAQMPGAAVVLESVTPPGPTGWPYRGVRALVPWGGLDHEPIKRFQQLSADREVYEVDFVSKYLSQLDDAAATLEAFSVPAGVPGQTRVAVGEALGSAGGLVMFSIGPNAPVGVHQVVVQIGTAGGRLKSGLIVIEVESA
jgi:hypothetical protein